MRGEKILGKTIKLELCGALLVILDYSLGKVRRS